MKKYFGFLFLIILVAGSFIGYKYYSETYQSNTAYALVPETVPEKKPTLDASGKIQPGLYSYKYTLTFVKENGKTQTMGFDVTGKAPTPLSPNSFITAKISKKRITSGPKEISEAELPENVLKALQKK